MPLETPLGGSGGYRTNEAKMLEFIQEFLNKLKKARLRKDQNLQLIVQQEFMLGQIRQQIVDIVAQNDDYKK